MLILYFYVLIMEWRLFVLKLIRYIGIQLYWYS